MEGSKTLNSGDNNILHMEPIPKCPMCGNLMVRIGYDWSCIVCEPLEEL